MSDHLFNWCQSAPGAKPDQYHSLCDIEYTTQFGVTHHCSCPGHAGNALANPGESCDNRNGPGGALTPSSGASPTKHKEVD